MKNRNLATMGVATALLAGSALVLGFAQPPHGGKGHGDEGDEEVEIKLAEAPEAVRAAVAKLTPVDKVTKVTRETDDGIVMFEVEYTADGMEASADLSSAGEVLSLEKGIKEGAIPAAAMAAIKKELPGATIKGAAAVQEFYFEVEVVVNGKTREVKVNAAGDIEDGEHGDHHDADKGKDGGKHDGKKGEKDDDDKD